MKLNAAEQAMRDGRQGPATEQAMAVLHAVGRAMQAPDCIPVASAHVGLSLSSLGPAGVQWLESMAAGGARVRIPTTTNVLSFERASGSDLPHRPPGPGTAQRTHPGDIDPLGEHAELQQRALAALTRMGALPSCSCNPFTQGHLPAPGHAVAWSESATTPFINGVLGAHTNREGATALASALTGVTPRYGMHDRSRRRAQVLFDVRASVDGLHRFHLLGAAVARLCQGKVPVLTGLRGPIDRDLLYGLSAALATYSSLSIFHIVGVTPEAESVDAAFGPRDDSTRAGTAANASANANANADPIEIDDATLDHEWRVLGKRDAGTQTDLAVIGCPHASLAQLQEIAALVRGGSIDPRKTLFVHTNAHVKDMAARSGLLAELRRARVSLTSDTCVYVGLNHYPPATRMLTDSSKMAFLMASRGLSTGLASTAECVRAVLA